MTPALLTSAPTGGTEPATVASALSTEAASVTSQPTPTACTPCCSAISSVSAERGGGVFGGVAYSAAKAAQLGFARALARELGPNGVTVNSVAPGLIDTDITAGKLVGEKEKQVLAGVPVGRKGRAADVADLITYLCREESGYITGATYDVNGGAHIH